MAAKKKAKRAPAKKRATKPQDRVLNATADVPDIRDRYYEPALIQLRAEIPPPARLQILDQGTEGACTGFGLAAVINMLNERRGRGEIKVSPRMLYEMAKRHDEWPGEAYEGSSLRGAIRGWHNMGVCPEADWPYDAAKPDSELTIARAKKARDNTLGAYYRLRPVLSEFHAAINETGILYVSATVHDGWFEPDTRTGLIEHRRKAQGGHAFAVVGYDKRGFWVQNSWNTTWGKHGLGLWLYEDWAENLMDAWAVRLAVPTPQVFGLRPSIARAEATGEEAVVTAGPRRHDVAGHFVHIDDGRFKGKGRYWSDADDVRQTADLVANGANYQHLLVYAHGGLNSPDASASRIAALKEGFKRNGIYPFHVMYDTGLAEELTDVVKRAMGFAEARAGGVLDFTDRIIESVAAGPGTAIWEEMKRDARVAFDDAGAGTATLGIFIDALKGTKMKIHLAGHSTGSILLGHLLDAMRRNLSLPLQIASCTLLAPACTIDFFRAHLRPYLDVPATADGVGVAKMSVFNLRDAAEQDDNVATVYRKSLLYLVSRAFERAKEKPLLGLEKYSKRLRAHSNLKLVYAGDKPPQSRSTSHGGFDNDLRTMNTLLQTILGKRPAAPFTEDEMQGY